MSKPTDKERLTQVLKDLWAQYKEMPHLQEARELLKAQKAAPKKDDIGANMALAVAEDRIMQDFRRKVSKFVQIVEGSPKEVAALRGKQAQELDAALKAEKNRAKRVELQKTMQANHDAAVVEAAKAIIAAVESYLPLAENYIKEAAKLPDIAANAKKLQSSTEKRIAGYRSILSLATRASNGQFVNFFAVRNIKEVAAEAQAEAAAKAEAEKKAKEEAAQRAEAERLAAQKEILDSGSIRRMQYMAAFENFAKESAEIIIAVIFKSIKSTGGMAEFADGGKKAMAEIRAIVPAAVEQARESVKANAGKTVSPMQFIEGQLVRLSRESKYDGVKGRLKGVAGATPVEAQNRMEALLKTKYPELRLPIKKVGSSE